MVWKKWLFRLSVAGLLIFILLGVIVLKPILTYASSSTYGNYSIFHNKPINQQLKSRLDQATLLVGTSELFNSNVKLDICLNDGSTYPAMMQLIQGRAFAYGFFDKVVLRGNINYSDNFVEINDYKWNLTQLLAHEMTHCYQYKKFGFWKSDPIANVPKWKWEGYPEYVARQNGDQKNLCQNITRLIQVEKTDNNGWIQFNDSTGTVIPYYKYWLLTKYCIEEKKMTYQQLIVDTSSEQTVTTQMMSWYKKEKN